MVEIDFDVLVVMQVVIVKVLFMFIYFIIDPISYKIVLVEAMMIKNRKEVFFELIVINDIIYYVKKDLIIPDVDEILPIDKVVHLFTYVFLQAIV